MDQADEEFEKAKTNRQEDPAGSCQQFIALATSYLQAGEVNEALECYGQAIGIYREFPEKVNQGQADRKIWHFLFSLSDHVDIETSFFELLQIAESEPSSAIRELDNNISCLLSRRINWLRRSLNRSGQPLEPRQFPFEKACWKRAIELRAAARGECDPSLTLPLEKYALACEGNGDIEEAEESFLRADLVSPTEEKFMLAHRQLRLAQFYIRQTRSEKLEEASNKLAKILKDEPGRYCNSLMELAKTFKSKHDDQNAKLCYEKALKLFKEFPEQISQERADARIWDFLCTDTALEEYDGVLLTLIEIAERNPAHPHNEVTRQIQTAVNCRNERYSRISRMSNPSNQPAVGASTKELWGKIIEIRNSARGPESPSLIPFLDNYALGCINERQVEQAELAYLKADSLVESQSEPELARRKIALAQFYARHKMFDKAEAAWRNGIDLTRGSIDASVTNSITSLIGYFESTKDTSRLKQIITAVLETGGTLVCKAIDQKLRELCTECIRIAAFTEAEKLMKLRLAATLNDSGDTNANDWRLRLSDLYLAVNREDESAALYQQVIGSMALLNESTDSIRAQRAALLQRLGRTDQATQIQNTLQQKDNKTIVLRFGLLASREMRFTHNTRITSFNSREQSSSPLYSDPVRNLNPRNREFEKIGTICSMGLLEQGSNFSIDGIIYASSPPEERRIWRGNPGDEKIRAVPADLIMLPPAPKAQPREPDKEGFHAARRTPFPGAIPLDKPGDFSASDIGRGTILQRDSERIRVFLNDDSTSNNISVGNLRVSNHRPIDFQIFYDGIKTLKVSEVVAVIYAPNATVELEFNGTFAGAIVASRIITHGNNQMRLDTSLTGVQIYP